MRKSRCGDSSALLHRQPAAHILRRETDTVDTSDNESATKAIAKALAADHTTEKPGLWLYTGGAGISCWEMMSDDDRLG